MKHAHRIGISSQLAGALLPALAMSAQLAAQLAPREAADPVAALRARPVVTAGDNGISVLVCDRDRRPVAGADVFVADWGGIPRPLRDHVESVFRADAAVWLAARTGAHFRSDAEGRVRVPRIPGASVGAIDAGTGAVGLLLVGSRILLRSPRVAIAVEVTDQKGRPAADVPVAIGRLHEQGFGALAGAITDANGRATVHFERPREDTPGVPVAVQACVVGGPPIRTEIAPAYLDRPDHPVRVALPPCSRLRVRLVDAAGKLVNDSRVAICGEDEWASKVPMLPDAGGYLSVPIAVDAAFHLELRHAGATGQPQIVVPQWAMPAGRTEELVVTAEFLPPKAMHPLLALALAAIAEDQRRQGDPLDRETILVPVERKP